jgi:NADPH-dependent 2,4-dienoyl-CoA reductase/sulfur reductase-like enzyme
LRSAAVVVVVVLPRATEAKEWPVAKHAVVIAGGGPTGMMLAAELALARVDVVIVERLATPDPDRSRANVK